MRVRRRLRRVRRKNSRTKLKIRWIKMIGALEINPILSCAPSGYSYESL